MKYLLLFTAILISINAISQEQCGTDEFHSYKMNTDLQYRENYYQTQEQIRQIIDSGLSERSGGEELNYVIPVVVHVIHLGEPVGTGSNISDTQIHQAIDGLNDRFANLIGNGLDINMSFCLAKRNPQGCPTNGIVRANGIGLAYYQEGGITRGDKTECAFAAQDEEVKDLSKWPVYQYYNIWVVHNICGGWAGYAYYPWGGEYDGAVMDKDYMTYNSTTLTHEIGHAFNLPHTFDGDFDGTDCPLNSNCLTQGDRVCDTPPHKISDCGSTNPCTTEGIWDNSRRNYMSYCGGTNRFTQGQKERMHASLQVQPRLSLLSSLSCSPSDYNTVVIKTNASCPGTCDGTISLAPACLGNYSYLWSTGETEASIGLLCPGTYSVTITESGSTTSSIREFTIDDAVVVDTTAMISISGELTICEGQSVTLTSNIQGTYFWNSGETTSSIDVTNEGVYSLTVTSPLGCINTSSELEVYVNPLPEVSFTLQSDINHDDDPLLLTTGLPEGGVYEGPGASIGVFYPVIAGVGEHVVSYIYTDENGCANYANQTIVVHAVSSIQELNDSRVALIYPNPNEGVFQLETYENENTLVVCYNTLGKIIFIKNFIPSSNRNVYTIEMPASAEGFYYLNLIIGDKSMVKTVLVQRNK